MSYSISDFRRDAREPYAWPGGYPRYFVTADGGCIGFDAIRQKGRSGASTRRAILGAIKDDDRHSGWRVIGCDINWGDNELHCDHTGERIESAYGEAE